MQRHSYRLEARDAIASVAISASLAQTRYATCMHSFHFENSVRQRFATLFVKSNAMNEKRVVIKTRNGFGWRGNEDMMACFPWNAVNLSCPRV